MRYFIALEFFGANYHGWQRQPNALAVQEVLEEAMGTQLRQHIELVGAGRTDAGVHARFMVAHFDTDLNLDKDEFIQNLNAFLPEDIAVTDLYSVPEGAHARFDAVSRTYEYRVVTRKDPFRKDSAYCVRHPLDVQAMNTAAALLLEFEDFKCFSRSKSDVKTYRCAISHARWSREDHLLIFTITADRFLRNMVRAVVGTLLEVGKHNMEAESLKTIIKSRNRSNAGASVPAKGLYLTEIRYPENLIHPHG